MRKLLIIVLSAAGLSACAQSLDTSLDAPMSPAFGRAFASMESQIIPAPVSSLPPDDTGMRSVAAIDRYQKGQVKQPQYQATSNLGGGQGGTGAGMGSSGN